MDIGDKTSFIGKREGVEVPVREPMQGGMIHPGVGCGRNGMVKRGVKAGRRSTWRLKGGIGGGGRAIVSKSKLGTEEFREGWREPRGQGGVERRQNGFKEVKERLKSGDGVRDFGIETVTVLAEMRVGADCVEVMEGAREGRDMCEGAERTGGE